ncbi:MAG: BRO family protein [candidate division KSB1 bacterium]|nr:BRO family protein [candidate division KSB1 bacterium]
MRTEEWNGHSIRFVENGACDWCAVLADISNALGLQTAAVARRLRAIEKQVKKDVISSHTLPTNGGPQKMTIVNEYGIYEAINQSRKKEAIEFRFWIYDVLKTLREASGLEGFQIFRMLDKDHQKEMMRKLKESLSRPEQVDYIKANTIANKAVSTKYGYPKMVKKDEMTPSMLIDRQQILEDVVNLMAIKERFGLDISVSKTIYGKYIS